MGDNAGPYRFGRQSGTGSQLMNLLCDAYAMLDTESHAMLRFIVNEILPCCVHSVSRELECR